MLNLSVKTRLSPDRAMAKVIDYYVDGNGLKMIEVRGHLHGENGAVEVAAIGEKIGKDDGSDWQSVLSNAMTHLQNTFDLHPEYYMLHFHAGEQAEIGHLTARVNTGKPTVVHLESVELDEITRGFAKSL